MRWASQKYLYMFLSILVLCAYGILVYGAFPATQYNPGETLDPSDPACTPGASNCSVAVPWMTDQVNGYLYSNNSLHNDAMIFGDTDMDYGGSGTETKMFFDKTNQVFRLGSIDNTDWDSGDVNVGEGSIALGFIVDNGEVGPIASGDVSIAIGTGTESTDYATTAIGYYSQATGSYATALHGGIATGGVAIALGPLSTASGDGSFAAGQSTHAYSFNETVFGFRNTAYTPLGLYSTSDTDRLFVVGNAVDYISPASDAFTILKNGKTGVGYDNFETTADDALLQVNGSILTADLLDCPLVITDNTGTLVCGVAADSDEDGYLTSTDWNTFNDKQDSLTFSDSIVNVSDDVTLVNDSAAPGNDYFYGTDGTGVKGFFNLADFIESSGLIGKTSGITSGGAPAISNETWLGENAGANSGSTDHTVFVGIGAGDGATNADNGNFIGQGTGSGATDAYYANFMGYNAGKDALYANNAIFLGGGFGRLDPTDLINSSNGFRGAGQGAENAEYSIFAGFGAGYQATNAFSAVFAGHMTGAGATNASYSNFVGTAAGQNAVDANNSNFIGVRAGYGSANASNSIFIGTNSGDNDTVDNTVAPMGFYGWSILIGPETSTGTSCGGIGCSNSIAIGAQATNTASEQFMIGSTDYPIDEVYVVGSAGSFSYLTTGTGWTDSSDERLKTNIVDLESDTLEKLMQVRAVKYHWKQDPNTPEMIGFLAQNLQEQFPQLVATDATSGYLSVYYAHMTPILVEAIRELNLKIEDIDELATKITANATFLEQLRTWLADATNGITDISADNLRAKDQICIDDECIDKDQLKSIIQSQNENSADDNGDEQNQEDINNEPEPDETDDSDLPETSTEQPADDELPDPESDEQDSETPADETPIDNEGSDIPAETPPTA